MNGEGRARCFFFKKYLHCEQTAYRFGQTNQSDREHHSLIFFESAKAPSCSQVSVISVLPTAHAATS